MSKNAPELASPWRFALLLILMGALLYSPAVGFDFTGYDDDIYVTGNPNIQRGVNPKLIAWAFTTGYASNWHPLTWVSHAVDWQIAGAKPGPHHATNILLHAINAVLLFVLLGRSTGALWPSFAVAALFAVHPFNVESVAWVAERKNVFSTFFGLCSLIAYSEYAKRPQRSTYLASCVLLACGLMSKPMLVTWPFVMLLLDYWPLHRIAAPIRPLGPFVREMGRLAIEKTPFFLIAALSSVTTYLVQARSGAAGGTETIPLLYRLGNAVVSYCDYLSMTVWPFGLAALYPHPFESLSLWKVLAAVVALSAATVGVLAFAEKKRYLATGWFFFIGTLVPVIGIVQVGSQAMADRYAYVPLIGIFIVAAWGMRDLCSRARLPRKIPQAAGCAVLILLMLRTWNQLPYWRDGTALWEHAIAVTSDNYIAHNNLGSALLRTKQPDRALAEITESLRIRPNHPGALVNLGTFWLNRGHPAEAQKAFAKAIAGNPRHGGAHMNLALAYLQLREIDKALEQAKLAEESMPYDPKVYNLLGIVSDVSGKSDDAVNYFRYALSLDPNYKKAQANLDRVLAKRPTGN